MLDKEFAGGSRCIESERGTHVMKWRKFDALTNVEFGGPRPSVAYFITACIPQDSGIACCCGSGQSLMLY